MRIVELHPSQARATACISVFGRVVERFDLFRELKVISGRKKCGLRRNFGDGGGVGGDYRRARGHGFSENNTEAFLLARQAEDARAIILGRQLSASHIAQPGNRSVQTQPLGKPLEKTRAGAVAHNPELDTRDARAECRGGPQQGINPLPAVEPANEHHGEAGRCGGIPVELRSPFGKVDGLGDDERKPGQPVELARAFRRIDAGYDYAGGAPNVLALPSSLHRHREASESPLEPHLIGNDALERGYVRRIALRDPVAVHIETDGEIEVAAGPHGAIEGEALEGVNGQVMARHFQLNLMAEFAQPAGEHVDANIGSAAAVYAERRRREKPNAQASHYTERPRSRPRRPLQLN